MMDRLESIERDFEDLEASLSDPSVLGDQTKLRDATRRYKQMTPIVECIRTIKATRGNADAARELMEMATGEERNCCARKSPAPRRNSIRSMPS